MLKRVYDFENVKNELEIDSDVESDKSDPINVTSSKTIAKRSDHPTTQDPITQDTQEKLVDNSKRSKPQEKETTKSKEDNEVFKVKGSDKKELKRSLSAGVDTAHQL